MKTEEKIPGGIAQEIPHIEEENSRESEKQADSGTQQKNTVAAKTPKRDEERKNIKRFKPDKKHIQGFVAGVLAAVILITGVTAAVNPSFLTGTFTKQVGNSTLQDEVDMQTAACVPANLKAQTSYDQTFLLSIAKDKIKSLDKEYIQLGGLFQGMTVENVSYSDSDSALAVAVKGNAATTHAFGSDQTNPSGEIYIMPDALKDSKTAYEANVQIEYPQLTTDTSLLENNANYSGSLSFTLSGDVFAKTLAASDVTLSGGFEKMKVTSVSTKDQKLTVGLSGDVDSDNGNGIITLAGSALINGFSVDKMIMIAGSAKVIAFSYITVAQPLSQKVKISITNDLFADKPTADMFTLGGVLANATVSNVERESSTIAWLTIEGKSLLTTGTGTVTIASEGTSSGRTVSGNIYVKNPQIYAYLVAKNQGKTSGEAVYDIYSEGDNFAAYISANDFVLKDGLAGLSVTKVDRIDGSHIKLTVSGIAKSGDKTISIRSDAMGGVTGAEATALEVENLGILDAEAVSAEDIADYQKKTYGNMNGQTGGFLDQLIDWGIDKIKDGVVDLAKSGLEEGAKSGLDYALRQIGLEGPPVEEMLTEIQSSLDELSTQLGSMETNVLAAINNGTTQTQLSIISSYETSIQRVYDKYAALLVSMKTYEKNNPGEKAADDPDIKKAMDALAGPGGDIERANIDMNVITIGKNLYGADGMNPLILNYYQTLKSKLPFEHNALAQLQPFVQQKLLYLTQGYLLYAEYCNYNMDSNTVIYSNDLSTFTNSYNDILAKIKSVLPSLDNANPRNVWGSPNSCDIKVKCNENGKTYIAVGDTFTISQMIQIYYPEGGDKYYNIGQTQEGIPWGIITDIYRNRGLLNNGIVTSYNVIGEDDRKAIFKDWDSSYISAPYTYLDVYMGDNGKTPNGWLFQNPVNCHPYWGPYVYDVSFYNLFNNTTETYNSWELYDHHADTICKIILVAR